MSAFDKLALAMIPSGYKGGADPNNAGGFLGRVYSVLPAQGQIDILNIQSVPSWANWDGSVITTDGNGDTGYINIIQNNEAKANRTYQLTVTAQLNNTIVKIYATGNTFQNLQEGTNTYTFVHDGGGNNVIRFRVENDSGITLSNISLTTASNGDFNFSRGSDATRVNSQGYIESVQASGVDDTDIPRLDYTNQACPSLLLEPQRSNLNVYSEDFSQWTTSGSTSITDNVSGVTSPDGNNKASLLDKNGQAYGRIEVINNVTTTGYYTFSVFAKKTDIDSWIKLRIDSATGAQETSFNLSNGEIGTSGVLPYDSGVQEFANGWYRFYIVANITDASANEYFRIYVMDTEGGEGNANPATAYIWGAQAELGSYPTSYIPTNGSTVTRLADVCNNAGDSTIFNDAEGVLYAEINKPTLNPNDYWLISVNDNTASNTVVIGWTNGGDELFARVIANGVVPVSYISGEFQKDTYYKIALKYKSGDSAVWVNGVEIHPDADTFTFSNSLKSINFDYGNGNNDFRGRVRSLLYFNEALTNEELEKLTSSTATQVLNNYSTLLTRVGATYESSGLETKLNELL